MQSIYTIADRTHSIQENNKELNLYGLLPKQAFEIAIASVHHSVQNTTI